MTKTIIERLKKTEKFAGKTLILFYRNDNKIYEFLKPIEKELSIVSPRIIFIDFENGSIAESKFIDMFNILSLPTVVIYDSEDGAEDRLFTLK